MATKLLAVMLAALAIAAGGLGPAFGLTMQPTLALIPLTQQGLAGAWPSCRCAEAPQPDASRWPGAGRYSPVRPFDGKCAATASGGSGWVGGCEQGLCASSCWSCRLQGHLLAWFVSEHASCQRTW